MDDLEWIEQFEEQRPRLRAVAYRMLGSSNEAEDAVQEAWLRASTADISGVENLSAWLTTIVARICLNMLRSRASRHESPLSSEREQQLVDAYAPDPEEEALLADTVGLALLVVLDTLTPAERLAFVLHDMFDLSFDDIGPIVRRSSSAARKLASRARHRVKGVDTMPAADLQRQRHVVDAYLAATRAGDFEALVTLLDPDVELHADREVGPTSTAIRIRGAVAVAKGALASTKRAQVTETALVNGAVGLLMAPRARPIVVLSFTIVAGRITTIDVIADPDRLRDLELGVLDADPA